MKLYFLGWIKRQMKANTHTTTMFLCLLSPSFSSSSAISLCVLRGLESRGKPSFLEPYLLRSLPSCKHPANASRHTDINIISNLPCFFFFLTCSLPVLLLQKCTVSQQWGRGCSQQEVAAQTLLFTMVAFKTKFKFRSLWVQIRD